MPGPSLYFPDGIPANVERLVSPDVIHRVVQKGLKDVARKWGDLAPTAASIASGNRPWWRRIFQGKTDIESKYLLAMLYLPPQKWPKGLSGEEKDLLNLLRRVRDLESQPPSYTFRSIEEARSAVLPTEEQSLKAFRFMAQDTKKDILKPMWRSYNAMLNTVGKEIEPLCLGVYGEECSGGEGAAIANADIQDAMRVNRLPLTPAQGRALESFFPVYGS